MHRNDIHLNTYSAATKHIISAFTKIWYTCYNQDMPFNGTALAREKILSTRESKTLEVHRTKTATNGEILLEFFRASWRSPYTAKAFENRNDAQVRDWLAWKLKLCVVGALAAKLGLDPVIGQKDKAVKKLWNRNSTEKIIILKTVNNDAEYTVGELYCLYDHWKGRDVKKRFDEATIAKMIGAEYDPFVTELNENYLKDIADLKSKHDKAMAELNRAENAALEEARANILKLYAEQRAELEAKQKEEDKALDDQYKDLREAAAIAAA